VALQDILLRLGAGEAELEDARTRLEQSGRQALETLEDPATCMACIEDVVLMALADGELLPGESTPIEQFLGELGFAQADMDLIMPRVKRRAHALGLGKKPANVPPLPPPPLPEPTQRTSRARTETSLTRPTTQPRRKPVAYRSPVSASSSVFDTVDATIECSAARESIVPASAGQGAARPEGTGQPSVSPDAVTVCQQARALAAVGEAYCWGVPDGPLNPWGCRLLEMPWQADAAWFANGKFRDAETFVFDRASIRRQLDLQLVAVRACPFCDAAFAAAVCEVLPSRASTLGRWRHRRVSALLPSAVPLVARTYRHGCLRTAPIWSDALVPTDKRDLLRIVARAAKRLGRGTPVLEPAQTLEGTVR